MSDRNGTFRAMFLVAIMVLSVVAMGAVFAGTAVADSESGVNVGADFSDYDPGISADDADAIVTASPEAGADDPSEYNSIGAALDEEGTDTTVLVKSDYDSSNEDEELAGSSSALISIVDENVEVISEEGPEETQIGESLDRIVDINNESVVFQGFDITNAEQEGIVVSDVDDASGIEITDNKVSSSNDGILVSEYEPEGFDSASTDEILIANNEIEHERIGLSVSDGAKSPIVAQNTVIGTNDDGERGILLSDGPVTGAFVEANLVETSYVGFQRNADGDSVDVLSNNHFIDNELLAIANTADGELDATRNYFGTEDSSEVEDQIGGDVDFTPFYTTAAFDEDVLVSDDDGEPVAFAKEIQTGVNIAEEGGFITVTSGTYEESVTVDENVSILSEDGPDETTIINNAEDSSSTVDIRSDNVTFAGFTVERQNGEDYSQGVAVRDNDTLVADNIITESDRGTDRATTQGILVTDTDGETSDIFIQENEISGFGEGVALSTQDEGGISDAFIEANSIADVEIGVKVSDFSGTEEDISGIIFDNTIENNEYGVFVFGDDEDANLGGDDVEGVASIDGLFITENSIVDNTDGVVNNGAGTLDATSNWWGAPTGPSGEGAGAGDSVSENVDFAPWLVEAGGDDIDPSLEIFLLDDGDDGQFNSVDQVEIGISAEDAGTPDGFVEAFEFNVILEDDGETVETFTVDDIDDIVEGLNLGDEVDELDDGDYTLTIEPTESVYDGLDAFDDNVLKDEVSFGIEEAPAATTDTGTGTTASPPSVSATITKSISDESPDTDGTTVSVNLGALNSITFSDEAASGMVEVEELSEVPATGPQLSDDQPFIAGSTITVPDEQSDQPATLELSTNADRLDEVGADADDLVVLRAASGAEEFETLDTEVEEENGEFTVTAETPGFSTFILSTDDGETDDEQEDDTDAEAEPEPEDEAEPVDEGIPGFGVVVALVALLGAALLAVRARRNA